MDAMPLSYVFAQLIYLIIVRRLCLYDVTDLAVDSLVNKGETGFMSFDFDNNYLGSNEPARKIFPEIASLRVDSYAGRNLQIKNTFLKWLEDFKKDESKDRIYYEADDKIYLVTINYLYDGKHRVGYQFFITDDTDSRKYMKLLANYNDQLSAEVNEKTESIIQMHNRLILGMATMVESRDNSTGGHIRRTSDVVRILIDEIKNDSSDKKRMLKLFGLRVLPKSSARTSSRRPRCMTWERSQSMMRS